MTGYFERRAAGLTGRNARLLSEYERLLICVDCGTPEVVFEAAQGARTSAEHQWLDPTTFKCWDCVEAIDCGGARG